MLWFPLHDTLVNGDWTELSGGNGLVGRRTLVVVNCQKNPPVSGAPVSDRRFSDSCTV